MTVVNSPLSFHRFNPVQRQILCWLRGVTSRVADKRARPTPRKREAADISELDTTRFNQLRRLAIRYNFVILPIESPYVSEDERLLLYYLGEFQRDAGAGRQAHLPADLMVALSYCAGLLDGAGARLPARRTGFASGSGKVVVELSSIDSQPLKKPIRYRFSA